MCFFPLIFKRFFFFFKFLISLPTSPLSHIVPPLSKEKPRLYVMLPGDLLGSSRPFVSSTFFLNV